MEDINNIVRTAFRKLKAHVYFDKTTLPLRDKVVAFEASSDFDAQLIEIANACRTLPFEETPALFTEILNSIRVLSFPKKMTPVEKDENTVISVGYPKEKPTIRELQYFIDMDVRGHILGIMWILAFGKSIDETCFKNSRGNRLRKSLIWNDDDDSKLIDSPALFEPYFAQYSLWRDGGLSCAKDLLSKGHDALIVTLDLTKFYYRVGITEEIFKDIITGNTHDEKLHKFIFCVLQRYEEVLREKSIPHSGIVLPIGFSPSAVLSNWCLAKFDKGILDYWNPSYYGRYVDDIIIVEKIEKGSEIYKRARDGSLTNDFVIKNFFGNGRWGDGRCFVEESDATDRANSNKEDDEKDSCYVHTAFCLSDKSQYAFQSTKTRIIALFADNNSTALLNKFKKEIYENVSEFRLMPEVGDAFSQDDYCEFYRLDNDATINKLRGIREILMDKYELSKFLGRYRIVSSLVEDGRLKKKVTTIIGKMFNDRELIENYILWERVFEIFITDKDYSGFSRFAKRVRDAIDTLTIEGCGSNPGEVKTSLKRHLNSALNRTLSLVWGKSAKEMRLLAIHEPDIDINLRREYLSKRMSNKYVMSIPAEVVISPSEDAEDKDVNFTDFTDGFKYLCKNPFEFSETTELLPYFKQAQDIALAMFLESICDGNYDPVKNSAYINAVKCSAAKTSKEDVPDNILLKSELLSNGKKLNNEMVQIGETKSDKLRIAIANVSVNGGNLENVLKGKKPNRKYARYRQLADLVNASIKEKADMLVLPENYVPIEWLTALSSKASREGLAIITGVEHILVEKKVYNFTAVILPFKYFKTIPTAAMFFQLKKHYSPEEQRIVDGYGYSTITEKNERPLYRWHDCYFPVYTCFELTSINDRARFMSWADMVVAVEFNRDTNYFSSIVESLTRDLHCYCVQVNTSEYGDSRIAQPTKREEQNLLSVKGGLNHTLLIGEVDIQGLREFQLKNYTLQKNGFFKPTPPGIDKEVVRAKLEDRL